MILYGLSAEMCWERGGKGMGLGLMVVEVFEIVGIIYWWWRVIG